MTALPSTVPEVRIRPANDRPVSGTGDWVLYWMIAARRTRFSFALQRAADWARHLGRPLVVLEALRTGYPWASDRLHRFVLEGMADNRQSLADSEAIYYPYVEPDHAAGRGLLAALAARAAVVVTDEFPTFFLPRMVAAAAERLEVRLEAVDGCGLLPMVATDRDFPTAYSFRRHLQRHLRPHLETIPLQDPLHDLPPRGALPPDIHDRWPAASPELLSASAAQLADLPIDHSVVPALQRGGAAAATDALDGFLGRLERYASDRNRPEDEVTSGLSPYLHFGHVSAHQVFLELMARERWDIDDLAARADGRRSGWWSVSESAEGFLDQLVTWRELGFNMCWHRADCEQYDSLPEWARRTLAAHAADQREHLYSLDEFTAAATHDPLWNAAQRQLVREGRLHNYLRMLWGKKILEWTHEPREALEVMLELNNRFALDGRDPNSISGIFWVLGRYDRAWGPERPVFGKVRYMSSANTARKVPVKRYIERYS
jgi:deoxyribodipyrimidine photo-lyase